jgi:hypothetical protein
VSSTGAYGSEVAVSRGKRSSVASSFRPDDIQAQQLQTELEASKNTYVPAKAE